MDFNDLLAVLPKIVPLLPRLTKGVAIVERITADPEAQDALAALEELAGILRAQEATKK